MRHSALPDFVVIGAMKSATTTLHEQLARQAGIFMSRPKEPNFFSDDTNFARGLDWYASCFVGALSRQLRGESSTHYTKLPTYPRTVDRMVRILPRAKLIYVMRHPVDRLRSHYLHELTVGRIRVGLEAAVDRHPELVDYGRYSMQLEPYLRAFGPERILLILFDCLIGQPQLELERIGRFLGADAPLRWDHTLKPQNVGRERLKKSVLREALVRVPLLAPLRRTFLPRAWVDRLKSFWQVNVEAPDVPGHLEQRLREVFDTDLARLGSWLGTELSCDSFREASLALGASRPALLRSERVQFQP
jgi:hypothetical protein